MFNTSWLQKINKTVLTKLFYLSELIMAHLNSFRQRVSLRMPLGYLHLTYSFRYGLPYYTNTISSGVLYMWRTYLNYPCPKQVIQIKIACITLSLSFRKEASYKPSCVFYPMNVITSEIHVKLPSSL